MNLFPRFFLICISVFILFACAVKEGPSGGPEDTIRPTILGVKPPPQSTKLSPDTKFHVMFSKAMDREKTVSAVFLSPVFWDYPEYKWKGNELIISPPRNLESNRTYVLTIGSDATGRHGNQMGMSYSYAFSTGDVIDSGSISGSIYLESGRPSSYDIWVYSFSSEDTAHFLTDIPHYATQVDSGYNFEISNIATGNYIVIAVDDKNDDLFWDPTAETIGLPPNIIKLETGQEFKGIVLRPERRDTVRADISKVRPIDNRKIAVDFTQPVQENQKLDTAHFKIIDSDSIFLDVEGAYIGIDGKLILETSAQKSEKTYWLRTENLMSIWGTEFDTSGARFIGSSSADSVGPELLSSYPAKGRGAVYENDHIELTFSERIKALGFNDAVIVIADSTDTLEYLPKWIHPNIVHLEFGAGIPREKNIDVMIAEEKIHDIADNAMGDSVLSLDFIIAPKDTVGIVIINVHKTGNLAGELLPDGSNRDNMNASADNKGIFTFDNVLPGNYYFRYYDDADSNGIWSSGRIDPFEPAEWFYYYRDSLDVRSRWTTTIELPE